MPDTQAQKNSLLGEGASKVTQAPSWIRKSLCIFLEPVTHWCCICPPCPGLIQTEQDGVGEIAAPASCDRDGSVELGSQHEGLSSSPWPKSVQSWRGWKQEAQDPSNEFTQPLEYQVFVFLRLERRINSRAPSWAAQLACPPFVWAPKELALIKGLFAPEAWVPNAFNKD